MTLLERSPTDLSYEPSASFSDHDLLVPELPAAPSDDAVEIDRRSIYISSVLGTTAFLLFAMGIPCWFAFNPAWGAGLGGMAALWGGPGYGVMVAILTKLRPRPAGR